MTTPVPPEQLLTPDDCVRATKAALEPLLVRLAGSWRRRDDAVHLYPERQSPTHPPTSLHESWLWFLQEVTLASAHDSTTLAEAAAAQGVIAGLFLPALLYVKLVAILDEALKEYITSNRAVLSGSYKGSLHGRLEHLDKHGALTYSQRLWDIKDLRNAVGHRPTSPANWQQHQVSWQTLAAAVDDAQAVLMRLGLVGPRPNYQAFAEREVEHEPASRPSVYMTHTYRYGVKEDDAVIIAFSHVIDYDRPTT